VRDVLWASIGLTFANLAAAAVYALIPPVVPGIVALLGALTLCGLASGAVFARLFRVGDAWRPLIAVGLFLLIRFSGALAAPEPMGLLPLGVIAASSALTVFAFWLPTAVSAWRGRRLAEPLMAAVATALVVSGTALTGLIWASAPVVLHLDPLSATAGSPGGAAGHAEGGAVLGALARVRAAPCDQAARDGLRDALLAWLRVGTAADPRALTMAGQALAAGILRKDDAPSIPPADPADAEARAMRCEGK
jgi:hypothetical protein